VYDRRWVLWREKKEHWVGVGVDRKELALIWGKNVPRGGAAGAKALR
jgi:hypothetical protein